MLGRNASDGYMPRNTDDSGSRHSLCKGAAFTSALALNLRSLNMGLFNLFWINESWQKKLTAEDAEDRRELLFFSASLCVLRGFSDNLENNKKSLEYSRARDMAG